MMQHVYGLLFPYSPVTDSETARRSQGVHKFVIVLQIVLAYIYTDCTMSSLLGFKTGLNILSQAKKCT